MNIKRVTYSVGVRPPTECGSYACAVLTSSGEPAAAPEAVHKGSINSALNVSGSVDAPHLWILNDTKSRANVGDRVLVVVHRSLQEGPRENASSAGETASLWTSEERLERVLVLEVAEEVAGVGCIERRSFLKVRWSKLVNLLADFKMQPPAVCLTVLQNGKPAPSLGNTLSSI